MGVKGLLGGGMLSDSKSVKQVTDPVKTYGIGAAPAAAKVTNFEEKLKDKRKKSKANTAFGVGSNLIN